MSRRKQARPRHVDDPDLDSPAIASNPVVPVFPDDSSVEEDKLEKTPQDITEYTENIIRVSNRLDPDEAPSYSAPHLDPNCLQRNTIRQLNSLDSDEMMSLLGISSGSKLFAKDVRVLPDNVKSDTPNLDAHVCGKCRAEFLDLDEFVTHKKECLRPAILLHQDDRELPEEQSELCNVNGVSSRMSEGPEIDNFEGMSQGEGSEADLKHDAVDPAVDEIDAGADPDDYENQSDYGHDIEDDMDKPGAEEDENEDEALKDEEAGDKIIKSEKTKGDVPNYVQSISNLLTSMSAGANSNVMLEPLEATKAAVAQFAENNLPEQERDVNRLQSALYSLQQQQLMQLQIIQQLQQQLVSGNLPNGQLPSSLLNGQLASQFPGLNLSLPVVAGFQAKSDESKASSTRNSPSPKSEHSSHEKEPESMSEKSSPLQSMEMPPIGGSEISKLSALASSASTGMSGLPSKSGSSSSSASSSTPAIDYSRSASKSGSDRGFLAADDPFFKHKCRMCHKVFGSDSALQIHLRSHTGEKPFQCNICGGRFSTRGNLKVHFQRHKAEFPNVEMNPNPVPEHLDKSPMPLLGSPFPAAALTPFANPAFMGMQGLMNGFMFPPPHLATRLPMTGHSMLPKPGHHSEDRRTSSSPIRDLPKPSPEIKKQISPAHPLPEPAPRRTPDIKESAKLPPTISPSSIHISKASPVLPISSMSMMNNYPVMSPLPSHPPFSQHRPPVITPTSVASNDPFRTTVLPSSILDNDDNLEQFMEIDKSETSKLQQLVDNIEHKLTDPNQCVICHRVLSCKSALQMHYRIHTGERPFKCKICGRSFTTKGNLKTHMGVHRAKPPLRMMHQCPVCHKQFTNLLVLQQHIRSHTGISDLPVMPNFPSLNMFGRHGMEEHHPGPLNMKRHFPEDYERELDLSMCKRPKFDRGSDEEKPTREEEASADGASENADNLADDVSDDEDERDAMDDEANKQAAQEAKKEGLQRGDSEERLPGSDIYDSQGHHPSVSRDKEPVKSEESMGFSESVARPPSPKYLQEDSNTDQDGSFNSYSASLAALEERVRAIDSTMACNPLSQFHASPYLLAPEQYTNGERASSPRSESGSDRGDKDNRKPSTPALSVSSEGSMGSNYMLGAMEIRPTDGMLKSGTMCNVCYKMFACRSALDIHYRSHTKERPYKCELCDKSFTTRGNMRQHLLTHKLENGGEGSDPENNNNNSCTPNQNDNDSDKSNDSSRFSESQKDFQLKESHESQVSNGKENASPSEKPAASTSSSSSGSSSMSVSSSRSAGSSYTSPDSQSPFINKPTVKHQCLVCQKGFSSASALQIHIRTHTGDKPFKCNVCGKAFTTKGNLKVHMGTHMWNNSPSRRGRRMSIEPPFMLAHKENPYIPHGFPPRPDFYPFQFPPFMNGLPTPPKSIAEMSIMSSMPSSVGMKKELPSPHSDMSRSKMDRSPVPDDKPKFAESGELDLSMKSTGSSGSRSSEKTSPSSVDSNSSSGMVSPPHTSLGWGWKASCHFCSRTFPTTSALEHHVRSMHMIGESLPKVGAS